MSEPEAIKGLLGLLLSFAALVYGLGPLLILSTFRMAPRKGLELFDPDDPELAAQFTGQARGIRRKLEEMGFELLAGLFAPSIASNVKAVLIVFVDRRTCDFATIVMAFLQQPGTKDWKFHRQFLSCFTRYRDGTVVTTTNSKDIGSFPRRPNHASCLLPSVKAASRLVAIHQFRKRREHGSEPILRHEVEFRGDLLEYFATSTEEELSDAIEAGYLRPPQDGVYRPTVKGAFLMTWKELWPWKWLRQLRVKALEKQLLSELAEELPQET